MRQRVRMSRYWARGKFGEHERGVRVAQGAAECNSSLLRLNNNTHLFSLSVSKFKRFLLNFLLKHMVNASSCTAELWMHSETQDCYKLTTRRITNSLLTSTACSIGIWSTLALLNLIRRIFWLCYKKSWSMWMVVNLLISQFSFSVLLIFKSDSLS